MKDKVMSKIKAFGFALFAVMMMTGIFTVTTYADNPDTKVDADGMVNVTIPTEINCTMMSDGSVVVPTGFSIQNNEDAMPIMMEPSTVNDYGYSVNYTLDVGGTRVLTRTNQKDVSKSLEFAAGESKEMQLQVSQLTRAKHGKLMDAAAQGTTSMFRMGFSFKEKKQAFAVYSEDDKSFNFYKRMIVPEVGSQFEGKTVTKVYTDIETTDWDYYNPLPWDKESFIRDVENVAFVDEISPISCMNWFYDFGKLKFVDVNKLDTSKVTSMYCMFSGCSSLQSLDVSGWDTSKVTNMGLMFSNCSSLQSLDLSGWDTSKVTYMGSMFYKCSSLPSIDVSGWNTSNVTSMSSMFQRCSSLAFLDVSGWDTSKVTDMRFVFSNCSSLQSLDLSGWNTLNVTNMYYMFQSCSSLTSLDVSGWNTSNVTNMSYMFNGCSSLSSIDVSGWNTSKVTNMSDMFRSCNSLSALDLSGWNTSKVTDMRSMFSSSGLKIIKTPYSIKYPTMYFITSKTFYDESDGYKEYPEGTFPKNITESHTLVDTIPKQAFAIYSADDNSFNFYKRSVVPEVGSQFEGKTVTDVFTDIETTEWHCGNSPLWAGKTFVKDVQSVKIVDEISPVSCYAWFNGFGKLQSIEMTKLDVSNVIDMDYMFYKCSSLTFLDLSSWDTSNVTTMAMMFNDCSSLTFLNVSGWNTSNVVEMGGMFDGCHALTTIDISRWNTAKVVNMGDMFVGCSLLTTLDVSKWDTSNVSDMSGMFIDCDSLTSLDLSDWNVSNVTDMSMMFRGSELTTIKTPHNIKTPLMGDIITTTFYDESDGYKAYTAGTFPTNITESHTLVDIKPVQVQESDDVIDIQVYEHVSEEFVNNTEDEIVLNSSEPEHDTTNQSEIILENEIILEENKEVDVHEETQEDVILLDPSVDAVFDPRNTGASIDGGINRSDDSESESNG